MQRSRNSQFSILSSQFSSRGFTLVELMVVVGIIILLVAVATPALGPMLSSNQLSQAVNTFNGMLITAQTAAEANGLPVGIRIERAYKTDSRGRMVDAAGRYSNDPNFTGPVWLNHQQIRYVIQAARVPGGQFVSQFAFRQLAGSDVVELPERAWIAPDYALGGGRCDFDLSGTWRPWDPVVDAPRYRQPWPLPSDGVNLTASYGAAVEPYNLFETFFIVFDVGGGLMQMDADQLVFLDETLGSAPPSPIVPYPCASARGALVYDRTQYNEQANTAPPARFLLNNARPVYINRFLGSTVEGQLQ